MRVKVEWMNSVAWEQTRERERVLSTQWKLWVGDKCKRNGSKNRNVTCVKTVSRSKSSVRIERVEVRSIERKRRKGAVSNSYEGSVDGMRKCDGKVREELIGCESVTVRWKRRYDTVQEYTSPHLEWPQQHSLPSRYPANTFIFYNNQVDVQFSLTPISKYSHSQNPANFLSC